MPLNTDRNNLISENFFQFAVLHKAWGKLLLKRDSHLFTWLFKIAPKIRDEFLQAVYAVLIYLFYIFIFGCVGSLLLREGFL